MAEAQGIVHIRGRGTTSTVMVASRPKIGFDQMAAPSPGNYGCVWYMIATVGSRTQTQITYIFGRSAVCTRVPKVVRWKVLERKQMYESPLHNQTCAKCSVNFICLSCAQLQSIELFIMTIISQSIETSFNPSLSQHVSRFTMSSSGEHA
jgi:hypothetical protein